MTDSELGSHVVNTATLVSVVIPCYNHAKFLGDAIRSVQRQDYQPIETIVVDDGSSDSSANVAVKEGALVICQSHSGLGAARNAGLASARGEYVVFLDADDELLRDAVSSGVSVLSADSRLACVVRRCQTMDVERRPLPSRHPRVDASDLYREWLQHNFVWTPGAAVFRRSRIEAIGGFPADLAPAADYALYLAFARGGEVAFEPRDAVRYRMHDSNMSRDPVLMLRSTLKVLHRERKRLPPELVGVFKAGLRNWRLYYGSQIIERLRHERRAGVLSPWQRTAIWAIVRHCPAVLISHLTRKLSRVLRGLPPTEIEPGRFSVPVIEAPRSRDGAG